MGKVKKNVHPEPSPVHENVQGEPSPLHAPLHAQGRMSMVWSSEMTTAMTWQALSDWVLHWT